MKKLLIQWLWKHVAWYPISKKPPVGATVLVRGQTYDVCLYRGDNKWFMGDLEYRTDLIEEWTYLPSSKEK